MRIISSSKIDKAATVWKRTTNTSITTATRTANWETWESYSGLQYIWFGHSTILLRLEGQYSH